MRIAVNTRLLLSGQLDGIGWFTYESFRRICAAHPEHEFHFIFDRPFSPDFIFAKNIIPHVVPPQARHPWLFRIWYDYTVPRLLRRIKADVFISPDAMMSLRTQVPQLIVMHDLNFEYYPQDIKKVYSDYLRNRSPLFAKKAARIVTVSEFSKNDIVKHYHVDPGKVDVAYNGANETYVPLPPAEQDGVRIQYTNGLPYFVFVGSIHPRKNLQRLLPAFDAFCEKTGADVRLVVVGKKVWFNDELEAAYSGMKHRDKVVFIGRLSAEDLHRVVGAAIASVYVSYFEGFGIPVVEAFRCGTPVITSTVTSLPEVAGDAALLVNPFAVEEISDALFRVWSDGDLRQELSAKGLERAKLFTWDNTAEKLWQSIEKIL